MLKLNREVYLDKLKACWIGKNIGGTLGAPFEGRRELLDIKGFSTPSGEPLPNDDLDLQLVWLFAMERRGPEYVNATVLSDYWLEWIAPHWNEYGIAKTNLRLGLLPPLSGELDNDKWKHSNGAWIRSEIWACFAPGVTDVAVKYAVADATVDHGFGEGTYAEIFTAVLQSAAYIESDIRTLIDTALSKIPEDCLVARTVRLVIECYESGVSYREARERVVEFNRELGWFQAPGNLGFVIIGLLYGEGDFKKSVLYAVNCGDDTDCTAGTVASTLGIIGGCASIPDDWNKFVGERIVTMTINGMFAYMLPKTCTEFATRIYELVPRVMKANKVKFAFTDEESDYSEKYKYNSISPEVYFERSRYSYDVTHYGAFSVRVEYDETPRVRPCESRHVKLTFIAARDVKETRRLELRAVLPDGWQISEYSKNILLEYPQPVHKVYGTASVEFDITVSETVNAVNRAYMEITSPSLAYPAMIPITFIG